MTFRSQLGSVMESLVKQSVCEITKLFEVCLADLEVEMTIIKIENDSLKQRLVCGQTGVGAGAGHCRPSAHCDGGACAHLRGRVSVPNVGTFPMVEKVFDKEWCSSLWKAGKPMSMSREADKEMPEFLLVKKEASEEDFDSSDIQEQLMIKAVTPVADTGKMSPTEQQCIEEQIGSIIRQDSESTTTEGKVELTDQQRTTVNAKPENGTHRHNVLQSDHSTEGDDNLGPEDITESLSAVGSVITEEDGKINVDQLSSVDVTEPEHQSGHTTEEHSELQCTPNEEGYRNAAQGPYLRSYSSNPGANNLGSITVKDETVLQSTPSEENRASLELMQEVQNGKGQDSRRQKPPSLQFGRILRSCSVRVERLSLQQRCPQDKESAPKSSRNPNSSSHCTQCGKDFISAQHHKIHQCSPAGEKLHCCVHCGRGFSQLANLKMHQRMYKGDRPHCLTQKWKAPRYACPEENPYSCTECGKNFSKASNLKRHKQVHTRERTHCCTQCGKRFSHSGDLIKHWRIHTGEKPYGCAQCGKSFRLSRKLQTHQRIHTGERPYSCSQCGKKFTRAANLMTHLRIHTGEKPNHCEQ
ncbi:uncharacterized protein LOC136758299 isoform X2 [Amia ocellicauda]|uniref:uncharacterized protein LOC136758299 isoform X2 n=1 Tax=Amia ocellicauda TaxID=2972642 RepID=UPI0034641660